MSHQNTNFLYTVYRHRQTIQVNENQHCVRYSEIKMDRKYYCPINFLDFKQFLIPHYTDSSFKDL